MIYQYSWNMCLFINDNTRGSCMDVAHLVFFPLFTQHLNQTLGERWIGRGNPVNGPAQSPDLNAPELLAVGTPKDFGVFSANQWLRGITATSREFLS
jgi:hypothetical protein